MPPPRPSPPTYLSRLLTELADFETTYLDIVSRSQIVNIDPNRAGSGAIIYIGAAKWGWVKSDVELEAARMRALRQLRSWSPRYRLLFPHPTPHVTKRLDAGLGRLERWLERDGRDKSVPSTTAIAGQKVATTIAELRSLADLLPADPWAIRLVVDTNSLVDNPDLAAYVPQLGKKYIAHLLPVVLREIDDLKRAGRHEALRNQARAAERRLKGLRANSGDVTVGVRVAGEVHAVFDSVEPRSDRLPSWLDLSVPDDRFVASALLLQSEHPASAVYVATSDMNLQTKLAAIGLPFVEVPDAP